MSLWLPSPATVEMPRLLVERAVSQRNQMTTCVDMKLCSSKHQCIAFHSIYWQKYCPKWLTSQCLRLWQPYGVHWSIVISSCFYWYKKKWTLGSFCAPYSCFLTSMADCIHKYWICVIDLLCYMNTELGCLSTLLSWKLKIYLCTFQSIFKVPGSLPRNLIVKLRMRLAQQRQNQMCSNR